MKTHCPHRLLLGLPLLFLPKEHPPPPLRSGTSSPGSECPCYLSEEMVTVGLCCPHAWQLGTAWGGGQACGPCSWLAPHPTPFYKYPTAHWLPSCYSNSFHEVSTPSGLQVPTPTRTLPGVLGPARPCRGLSRVLCLRRAGGVGAWAEAWDGVFPKL